MRVWIASKLGASLDSFMDDASLDSFLVDACLDRLEVDES